MRILGIDPGFDRLGVAVLEKGSARKETVLFSECFTPSARLPFEQRLAAVGQEVRRVIGEYRPDLLAIETLFLVNNKTSGMRVAEARGVVLYEAAAAGLAVFEASPSEIKVATTGYGKSGKKEIIKMVKMLVDMKTDTQSDDELDAVAVALTASARARMR